MKKDIITCFRLIRYGKKAKMNIVMGIIFLAMWVIVFPLSMLTGSANIYPAFLLMEGAAFLTQPAMSIAQRGFLAVSPVRRAAELHYQPLCIFLPAAAGNVLYALTGAVFTALGVECAGVVIYTIITNLLVAVMFVGIIAVMKSNFAGYIGMIIGLSIAVGICQAVIPGVSQSLTANLTPAAAVLTAGAAGLLGCALVWLAGIGVSKALYKKNYGKYVRQMLDINA